ncbi:hypothetical protein EJB05_55716, partial [Eragrostis curvula]
RRRPHRRSSDPVHSKPFEYLVTCGTLSVIAGDFLPFPAPLPSPPQTIWQRLGSGALHLTNSTANPLQIVTSSGEISRSHSRCGGVPRDGVWWKARFRGDTIISNFDIGALHSTVGLAGLVSCLDYFAIEWALLSGHEYGLLHLSKMGRVYDLWENFGRLLDEKVKT